MTGHHQPGNLETTSRSGDGAGRSIAILLAILLMTAGVMIYRAASLPCISRDGVFFVEFAGQLAEDPLHYMRVQKKQPGYSWLLLAMHHALGDRLSSIPALQWERSGQLLAMLGGLATIGLLYCLTRSLFDARTGLVAAGLAAVWPQCVYLSSDVLSDVPHLGLYLAALCLGLHTIRRPTWPVLVACGLVGGLGYLVRQEALGIPLAVGLALMWPRAGASRRRRVLHALAVMAAFGVVVAPYQIAVGRLMHNKTILDLLFGSPEPAVSADCLGAIHADFVRWWSAPWVMLTAWGQSGAFVLSTWAVVGFFWRRVPRGEANGRRLLAAAAGLQLLAAQLRGSSFDVISNRYMLIPAALSIPWAAAGLRGALGLLAERIRRRRNDVSAARVSRALALVTALALSPMIYRCLRLPPSGADAMRAAGNWLRTHATSGDRLAGTPHMDRVAFYAGLPHLCPDIRGAAPRIVATPGTWFADLRRPDEDELTPAQRGFLTDLRRRVAGHDPVARYATPPGPPLDVFALP